MCEGMLFCHCCRRARVFRALVPPDALNPQGATNGNLDSFMPTLGVS